MVKHRDKKNRSCNDKVRYEDETAALAIAIGMFQSKMRAYPCRHCQGWHLSSKVDRV